MAKLIISRSTLADRSPLTAKKATANAQIAQHIADRSPTSKLPSITEVTAAQGAAEKQNLEIDLRKRLQASKAKLQTAMEEVAYANLQKMASDQMAQQHAINVHWPHNTGWALQKAKITAASSPVAVAADIQSPPLPPVEAKLVRQGPPPAHAPSPLLQAKTGSPAPASASASAMSTKACECESGVLRKALPWVAALGVGFLLFKR